ncbi:hypothetical protein VR7878_01834 [Vibrio ruber DSM 16370]|uniref:Uncharacterized protein n=1 Tax=Vibrio ruber (strain DSM 16370 / JCM 11486 / BCRC 17186 / CECT 7878 / LMG 23124 / VR1) TaxID=1123498 RepID=A0A1R4LJA7_VIBR1|nr:hypothetical protein [Vibrio ruber]SJN56553.1 hypothetical protein VR7878_01834 [Vibrio ruber DSM 16370]
MKKIDNSALAKHLEKANKTVSQWPQWQQQLLQIKISDSQQSSNTSLSSRKQATN